ncbi:MAG TPA: DUF4387 domain-containing protein [Verrucomicrobiae bacterium]|nr:DUF4387 domain-containing protein [Verrucomicrobiae bacterium]
MHKVKLPELAEVIRSKNAGPYELTVDVIFKSREVFEKVIAKKVITPRVISNLYKISEDKVISVVEFPPAKAIKATMVRSRVCGDVGDTDVYGAQQHAPLLGLEIDWE